MSKSQETVKQSHRLGGETERITEYYEDWATSYDEDLRNWQYLGPENIGVLFTAMVDAYPAISAEQTTVLDAGCGTGLAGVVLARRGVTVIDGFDLSDAMVGQARETGVYRALTGGVDMNRGLEEYPDNAYDVSVSCGVFTLGHVPPEGLRGLLRVTRPGGLVLVSTHRSYLAETDFEDFVTRRADDGDLRVVRHLEDVPYTAEGPADYWTFEVLR